MGILKNIVRAKISGNVGSMNFRQRGQQIVVAERSYKNASKGSGASYKQRKHRCRMANVCNFFQTIAEFDGKAWQNKDRFVSAYNMFAKANLATSPIFLTKEMADADASVIAPYIVSKGTLPSCNVSAVTLVGPGLVFASNIAIDSSLVLEDNTVGAVSASILTNNADFEEGDKISIICLINSSKTVLGVSYPTVKATFFSFTLDKNNVTSFSSLNSPIINANGVLGASATNIHALAMIHTRTTAEGFLVSSEVIALTPSAVSKANEFSTSSAMELAMSSYGYADLSPLDPGSVTVSTTKTASITSVKFKGSDVANGDTLSGTGVLTVAGTDLSTGNVAVSVDGVVFVPQTITETELTYTINANGSLKVFANGNLHLTATISGAAAANFTSFKIGDNTYTSVKSNLNADILTPYNCNIVTASGSTVTCSKGTIANMSKSGDTITFRWTAPATFSTPWTLSLDGVVFASGYTAADPDDDPLIEE